MERPLRKIKANTLRALYMGIKWHKELVTTAYYDEPEMSSPCRVCAIGAIGKTRDDAIKMAVKHKLIVGTFPGFTRVTDDGVAVENLNVECREPTKRREFMLRHIVEELRQREKSLPVKTNKYQEVK